jgi:CPA2 family monovalent cation:H+ antiporter-2
LAGIDSRSAIVIGAAISLSSTASVFRLLADKTMMESAHGRPAVGVLLIQDAAVVPLVLLVTALSGSATFASIAYDLAKVAVISAGAFAVMFVLLNHIVPRALAMKAWTKNRELPMLLSVVVAIGASMGAHKIGVSPAFGAFLAGMLLAESPFSTQIRADIGSLRAVMVTLFFAAVGMFADPIWIANNIILVLAVSVLILVAKTAIVSIIMIAMKFRPGVSVAAGMCLSQVGEFSFALASIALASLVLSQNEFKLIVSATIMTLLATPYLVNASSQMEAKISSFLSARNNSTWKVASDHVSESGQKQGLILVIGFGPAGKKLVERLKECYAEPIKVIDINPLNAQAARSYGVEFQIGDAANTEVLEHAGVRSAVAIAITLPDPEASIRIIHLSRALNPAAIIAARARYDIFAKDIENAGAASVVNEEEQVGIHLAVEVQSLLRTKGVCSPQPH